MAVGILGRLLSCCLNDGKAGRAATRKPRSGESVDTVSLRTVRQMPSKSSGHPSMLGRGYHEPLWGAALAIETGGSRACMSDGSEICGTITSRRRLGRIVPDRKPETAQAWLSACPPIAIVARDRGGGDGEAKATAPPHALQVVDRWHLMENGQCRTLGSDRM